jgi:hypothetical protein
MKHTQRSMLVLVIALMLVGSAWLPVRGATPTPQGVVPEPFPFSDRYPAEVQLASPGGLEALVRLKIDVGQVQLETGGYAQPGAPFAPLIATVFVSPAEAALLAQEGLVAVPIPNESLRAWREYGPGTEQPSGWPTYDAWVTRMQTLVTNYPNLVRMVSIGQSVQGRQLWMLKITDNPDVEENEPEFRYVSTMHGIEPVGAELILRLAELLTSNYGVDPTLTAIVDGTEIWLFPLFNPDGYMSGSYYNAHGVNLNRDFPDRVTDPVDDPAGREPETQAAMNFTYGHSLTMGANYHSGALVVNYPWDSVPQPPDYAPDDALYYQFSVGYSSRNPMIWNGGFPNGVTRGWEWYIIRGGMQDWAYYWHNEHHVTIEVSNSQPPPYDQMNTYWTNNKDAMLWWMQRALTGVRGLVTDATTGLPLDATVDVLEVSKPLGTDPQVGDYHRMLLPGTFTVHCSAAGYIDQSWTVQVVDGPAAVRDCALLPESAPKVHVGVIKIQYADRGGGRYVVSSSMRILDETNHVVSGATVSSEWTLSDGSVQAQEALTNAKGLASFRIKVRQPGSYQICVENVVMSGYVYDPGQNGETCDAVTIP